jgi:hypothetical protein
VKVNQIIDIYWNLHSGKKKWMHLNATEKGFLPFHSNSLSSMEYVHFTGALGEDMFWLFCPHRPQELEEGRWKCSGLHKVSSWAPIMLVITSVNL